MYTSLYTALPPPCEALHHDGHVRRAGQPQPVAAGVGMGMGAPQSSHSCCGGMLTQLPTGLPYGGGRWSLQQAQQLQWWQRRQWRRQQQQVS